MGRKRKGKGRVRRRATVISGTLASAVAGAVYLVTRRRNHTPDGQPDGGKASE